MRHGRDRMISRRAADVRASIATWLLEGPAQLCSGEHAGAVAGCLHADDSWAYAYPEITGYFLQWLAWRASQGDAVTHLRPRAEGAQVWLARWSADVPPRTRVYPDRTADWRNDAMFTFDVAMVLRGVANAARTGLVEPDADLVERLDEWLVAAIAEDGLLDACRAHEDAAPLPQRWSTRRGSFLAKAAAGVLSAAGVLNVSARATLAAAATLGVLADEAKHAPHAELHARLYAIEGALTVRDPATRAALARQLAPLFDAIVAGRVDADAVASGAHRLDVRAQALRIGCVLCALDVEGAPARAWLGACAGSLAAHVTNEGALPFASGDAARNVWTALFAEQALAWLDGGADLQWLV